MPQGILVDVSFSCPNGAKYSRLLFSWILEWRTTEGLQHNRSSHISRDLGDLTWIYTGEISSPCQVQTQSMKGQP